MIEDDFYATLKFKNGEEIFCKVAPTEEEDRTLLLVSNPIMVSEIKHGKGSTVGYRLEPWLKTTEEDMFVVNMNDVLTLSETTEGDMIAMYEDYLQRYTGRIHPHHNYKIGRSMGYISTVNAAKDLLEKLYNSN